MATTKKAKKPALTEVKDFNGTPTHVGDTVVFIYKTYCTAELMFGKVEALSRVFGQDCVVIDPHGCGIKSKPTSRSFYKVDGGSIPSCVHGKLVSDKVTKAVCEATCG